MKQYAPEENDPVKLLLWLFSPTYAYGLSGANLWKIGNNMSVLKHVDAI